MNGLLLNNLKFADDVVLISASFEKIQGMSEELAEANETEGLEMYLKDTKLLADRQDIEFSIKGNCIEVVTNCVYLGRTVSSNRDFKVEINNRIKKALCKFWPYKTLLKNKLGYKSEVRILNSCVIPSLLYMVLRHGP